MTTITSNGYYLIADNRVTINKIINTENKTPQVKRKEVTFFHNGENKISLPQQRLVIEKQKVLAWTGSGNPESMFNFINNAKKIDILDYVDIYSNLVDFKNTDETFTIFLITENYCTYVINFNLKIVNSESKTHLNIKRHNPGVIAFSGSGSNIISDLLNYSLIDIKEIENQHPLLTHLFMYNSCKYSSFSYDVYGAKEKQFFSNIEPGQEAIEQSIAFFNNIKKDFHYHSK